MKYCTECKEACLPDHNYCEKCGKQLIEVEKYPEKVHSLGSIVYGPPYRVKYKCSNCNSAYIASGLGSSNTKYCPFCGEPYGKDDAEDEIEQIMKRLKR